MGDLGDDFENPRFMTPCSDDMTQPLSLNPKAIHHQLPNHPGYSLDASPEFLKQEPGLEGPPDFSAFEAAIDMSNFVSGANFDLSNKRKSLKESNQRLNKAAAAANKHLFPFLYYIKSP